MLVEARGPVRGRFHEQRLRADYLRRAHRPYGGVPEQLGSHVHDLVAHVHAEHAQKNRRNRIRAVPPEPAIGLGMADTVRAQRVEPGQRAVAERGIGDRRMLLAGILLGPYVLNLLDDSVLSISSDLRQMALSIILIKAGLSLNLSDLKKVGRPAILMSFVPATFEIIGYVLLAPTLLGISKI